MSVNACQLLKEHLAEYLSTIPQRFFLFWKGRVAFYAISKTLPRPGTGIDIIENRKEITQFLEFHEFT